MKWMLGVLGVASRPPERTDSIWFVAGARARERERGRERERERESEPRLFLMDFLKFCVIWLVLVLAGLDVSGAENLGMAAEVRGVQGKSVTFTADGPPVSEVQTVTWSFAPDQGQSVPMYTGTKDLEKITEAYKDRMNYNRSTYTLELRALTLHDAGVYTLTIVDSQLDQRVGHAELQVLEPVKDVTISSNIAEAVEFNSTVVLTCNAKGSSLTYSWLNNSDPVLVDGKHIVQNGSQLVINEVYRSDLQGLISCTAKNQLESSTSAAFNMTISYGPELVTKTQEPNVDDLKKGSTLTFRCSAKSSPAAEFIWLFNDAELSEKTDTLVLSDLSVEHSGNYTCMVHNTKTLRYVTSDVTELSVFEAISGVSLAGPPDPLIAGNSSVNISCTVDTGTAENVEWYKDGKPLVTNSHVILTSDESTVTILTVKKEDAGNYKCSMKNKISSEDSNIYTLNVFYGPHDVKIMGEKEVDLGQGITINCTAASSPFPTFKWMFNDTEMQGETNPCITIHKFEQKHSGVYVCEASNPKTGLKATATHSLMVKDDEQKSEGLSGGAIAGIVIAVLVALAIVIGACMHKKRKYTDVPSPY